MISEQKLQKNIQRDWEIQRASNFRRASIFTPTSIITQYDKLATSQNFFFFFFKMHIKARKSYNLVETLERNNDL